MSQIGPSRNSGFTEYGHFLLAFISAPTWNDSQLIVTRVPWLLSTEADAALDQMILIATLDGLGNEKQSLEEHKILLKRCGEIGIERAFEEKLAALDSDSISVPLRFGTEWQAAERAHDQFAHSRNPEFLETALALWQTILRHPQFAAESSRFQAAVQNNIAKILLEKYNVHHNLNDLNDALAIYRQLQDNDSLIMSDRVRYLRNSAKAHIQLYWESDSLGELDKAIELFCEAERLSSSDSFNHLGSLMELGGALDFRYERLRDLKDLEKATHVWQQAVNIAIPNARERASCLIGLSLCFNRQYEITHNPSDITEAIALSRQALELNQLSMPEKASALKMIGSSLHARYRQNGDLADLDNSIDALLEAKNIAPSGIPERAEILTSYALSLFDRDFDASKDLSDLNEAIASLQEALSLTHSVSQRANVLDNLGNLLRCRYERINNLQDLELARSRCQEAVRLTTPDDPAMASCAGNLAFCFHAEYERTGEKSDLEEAIRYFRLSTAIDKQSSASSATQWNGLGHSLLVRYHLVGVLSDLEEAINAFRKAIAADPVASTDQMLRLKDLAIALHARYQRRHERKDLNEAIACWEAAAGQIALSSVATSDCLNSLGIGLLERYSLDHDKSDLTHAIGALRQAVDLANPASIHYSDYLSQLGVGLFDLYKETNDPSDLDQAIDVCRQAIKGKSDRSPYQVRFLSQLADGLRKRYTLAGNAEDLAEAINAYRQACHLGDGRQLGMALGTSQVWGLWAKQRESWKEAVEAFEHSARVCEHLFRSQLNRHGKEYWLQYAQYLPSLQAYCLAKCGQYEHAALALERGRTQLLNDVLDRNRVKLENLVSNGYVDLYERYQNVANQIARFELPESHHFSVTTEIEIASMARNARAELDQIIEEIQCISGYEDFFGALEFEQIQRTLTQEVRAGVYLLTTSAGSLALIVHVGGVKEVWLDSLTEDEISTWLIKRDGSHIGGGYLLAQMAGILLDVQLNDVLPLLDKKLMHRVAEELKALEVSDITLIPCGRLALFPLHAAEYQVDGQTRRFMDEFTVTYAPSARAVGSCWETLTAVVDKSPTLSGVGNPLPLPEGASPLAYARPEVEEISSLFGEATTLLYEQQATREVLNAQLGKATYLHLSCHGLFNAQDPLESGVVLANGEMLTVRDLIGGQRLRGTRLVVLSACQTAITDFKDLPEEAIGLPGGFVQAGVPGVVGTLWPVNALSTMLLMVKFYEAHLKEGLAPAAALRKAQLWLRDVTNAELYNLTKEYCQQTDLSEQSRSILESARRYFRDAALPEPEKCPYAHPYYWAAFAFYGV